MDNELICGVCMHRCRLKTGQKGFCRARENKNSQIVSSNYGLLTSMALDPIEKKPLSRFYPGSKILSVGSFGCNLRCPFCQNYEISQVSKAEADVIAVSPQMLVERAVYLRSKGNIGIAYTYNEPMVGYEYVRDCSRLARQAQLKNVVVTNGCVCQSALFEVLPYVDAFNVDLKGFSEHFYEMVSGRFELVMNFIKEASKVCHVELTTLIIPNENDSEDEIDRLSEWVSHISPDIVLHITRFFPMYNMTDRDSTNVDLILRLVSVAKRHLRYVYAGNI